MISNNTVWEFKTVGASDNGGGFVTGSGGTDYSQQASAQLSLTDLECAIASTTLTSVTGGFTSAMVGNLIQISGGTNFLTGWFEITAFTDTNTVTIDRTACDGVGNGTGGSGKVGGALDTFTDAWVDVPEAGNIVYMQAGTYTMPAILSSNDGTLTNKIKIEGYNVTRGDAPDGTNRPLLACSTNQFNIDDYWNLKHLRFTTNHTDGITLGVGALLQNIKILNDSGTPNLPALHFDQDDGIAEDCEFESTNGYAVLSDDRGQALINCYLHDSVIGWQCTGLGQSFMLGSIVINCTTAGVRGNVPGIRILRNTIYNCGIGIDFDTARAGWVILNNLIDTCTVGIESDVTLNTGLIDYNNYNNNGTDVINVTKGANATNVDPLFTNAAGGNFSLQASSPARGAGVSIRQAVG